MKERPMVEAMKREDWPVVKEERPMVESVNLVRFPQ
jgi:hypothetical protein